MRRRDDGEAQIPTAIGSTAYGGPYSSRMAVLFVCCGWLQASTRGVEGSASALESVRSRCQTKRATRRDDTLKLATTPPHWCRPFCALTRSKAWPPAHVNTHSPFPRSLDLQRIFKEPCPVCGDASRPSFWKTSRETHVLRIVIAEPRTRRSDLKPAMQTGRLFPVTPPS